MAGWLGSDIGGYTQGPMLGTGDAGVPRTGITWGDILGTALQFGSKPGSSGPSFGAMVRSQGLNTQQLPMMDMSGSVKKKGSDLGEIAKLVSLYFGGIF